MLLRCTVTQSICTRKVHFWCKHLLQEVTVVGFFPLYLLCLPSDDAASGKVLNTSLKLSPFTYVLTWHPRIIFPMLSSFSVPFLLTRICEPLIDVCLWCVTCTLCIKADWCSAVYELFNWYIQLCVSFGFPLNYFPVFSLANQYLVCWVGQALFLSGTLLFSHLQLAPWQSEPLCNNTKWKVTRYYVLH